MRQIATVSLVIMPSALAQKFLPKFPRFVRMMENYGGGNVNSAVGEAGSVGVSVGTGVSEGFGVFVGLGVLLGVGEWVLVGLGA